MPACPHGPHRMNLADDLSCRRCGGDLRLYATLRDLPVVYYNQGRKAWDEDDLEAAARWLHAALAIRGELAEAHWILGLIEARHNRPEEAWRRLDRARELGARVDPEEVLRQFEPEEADPEPDPDQELEAEADPEQVQRPELEAAVDPGPAPSQEPGDSPAPEVQEGGCETPTGAGLENPPQSS